MDKNNENKEISELKKFLLSIPAGDVENVTNELISLVKSNRTIFRNWRLNLTQVPILEKSLMNDYAMKKYGKQIFTTPQ